MKIYKLLLLLLVFVGLHSCTEYLDNGTKNTGPEPGEIPEFKAGLADEENKYVGDTIVLKAELNGVDVTSTTVFKVNGVELKRDYSPKNGNIYVAKSTGEHSVVATLDDFMDSFTFTVIKKEEEPDPINNRIEYNGESYPVNNTFWIVNGDGDDGVVYLEDISVDGETVSCTKWLMVSTDNPNLQNATAFYYNLVYVGLNPDGTPAFPDEGTIYFQSGLVRVNTTINLEMNDAFYSFNAVTSTNADYTSEATLENSQEAKLYWNGAYQFGFDDLSALSKGKKGLKNFNTIIKSNNMKKILKVSK